MKKILGISAITIATAGLVGASMRVQSCKHTSTSFMCVTYVENYDGDTIKVNISKVHQLIGKNIDVRVLGVDTPEMTSTDKCEKEAALRAKNLVELKLKAAKRIDLLNVGRDKYFRILANVSLDGNDLTKMLLDGKYGIPYSGGTKQKKDWCKP